VDAFTLDKGRAATSGAECPKRLDLMQLLYAQCNTSTLLSLGSERRKRIDD
jgi:hypothetical protein